MNRTQIYLNEAQHEALASLAKVRSTTASALIRQAIDDYLASQLTPRERVAALRDLASRVTVTVAPSEGESIVNNLRQAGADRLSSRE